MQILIITGSLRKESFNTKLAKLAIKYIKKHSKFTPKLITLNDYNLPIFNQDKEKSNYPVKADKLAKLIKKTDAIIFVSPEYNGGIPGGLKNLIDWISRHKEGNLWNYKKYCLMGATIGPIGTYGNFVALSQVLLKIKGWVFGEFCGVAFAEKAFGERGELKEDRDKKQLDKTLSKFLETL